MIHILNFSIYSFLEQSKITSFNSLFIKYSGIAHSKFNTTTFIKIFMVNFLCNR